MGTTFHALSLHADIKKNSIAFKLITINISWKYMIDTVHIYNNEPSVFAISPRWEHLIEKYWFPTILQ